MGLIMRWVGDEEQDRVAETRWKCFGHAQKELARYKENLRDDPWARPGDHLLAEQDGAAVGTATSLPLTLWVRRTPIPCQGVAFVGTIKSARRQRSAKPGVASSVMHEMLRMARQREDIVSALMPFRASFYEHFGYGIVERRAEWTIPLTTLHPRDSLAWRLIAPEDRSAQTRHWQSFVENGQCDIERSARRWQSRYLFEEEGMVFVDRPDPNGPIRGTAFITLDRVNDRSILKVQSWSADSPEIFGGLLSFLGAMRDQYSAAAITVPADWPVNRLLREAQIPHRPVDHPTAEVRPFTRMQLRILDHQKYLESLNLPTTAKGRVSIEIKESEGIASKFSVQFEAGRASVSTSAASPDFECLDRNWAAIATGDLSASRAVRWGVARENTSGASTILDALAVGPTPFCNEYF